MLTDLQHNKIVGATITDKFRESVEKNLIPMLEETYRGSLCGIQICTKDYISDGFSYNKEWYYPLTVITESGRDVRWIKWEMKKSNFENGVPYAYIGSELLSFSYAYEVPEEFVRVSDSRAHYFGDDTIKIRVETTAKDITFLSGKYSQTFVDEMARQLTPAICDMMGIKSLSGGSVELALVFAPETYMEHTSENVTYRRLLIVDKTSSPKDFWIKWTRLDGRGAYTVSDHVDSSSISFEIGEDVPQKVKEKEYRYLTSNGKEKYHVAMGRKNIIAWREVIKRAVRKGELEKVEIVQPVTVAAAVSQMPEVEEAEVVEAPEAVAEESAEDNELELAMEMARRAMDSIDESDELIDDEEEEDSEEDEEVDELEEYYAEEDNDTPKNNSADDDEERRELDEITRMAMEALKLAKAEAEENAALVKFDDEEETDEVEDGEISDEEEESDDDFIEDIETEDVDPTAEEDSFEEIEDEDALDDTDALEDVKALEPDEEEETECCEEEEELEQITIEEISVSENQQAQPIEVVSEPECRDNAVQPTTVVIERSVRTEELEEKIRSEIEAKIRLEYESRAREKAEAEAEKLRREQEQLRMENERLIDRARREKAEWERIEEARKAEAEKLRIQIENQVRQEAKERERLAEAARASIEEQHRLEAERLRNERLKIEEERRLDEERRRREEEERKERERLLEEQRQLVERERAQAAAAKTETKEAKEEPQYVDKNYTYVSKTVKLIFRRSVDPNITARLHEIIKATLEYYGKEKVYMRIKATVPDNSTVCLDFVQIPLEEMELLGNIIKVIGNSGLGIAKAILE